MVSIWPVENSAKIYPQKFSSTIRAEKNLEKNQQTQIHPKMVDKMNERQKKITSAPVVADYKRRC